LLESEVSRHITLGKQVLQDLSKTLEFLRIGKKILFIIQDSKVTNEYFVEINKKIAQHNYDIETFWMKSQKRDVSSYINTFNKISPNTVILFGDTGYIDYGKYILSNIQHQKQNSIDWLSIPTTPESDSVCSPFIFLDLDGTGEKYLGQISPPLAIIADTEVLSECPQRLLLAGISDLLSRQTSIWDWKLANRLRGESISDFVVAVSNETIDILTRQLQGISPDHEEAIPIVMKALLIAGFLSGFAADVRACYGSEHMFAQALDMQEPGKASHGERVALGTIMMASLQGQDWRSIKKSMDQFNILTSASKLDFKSTSIVKALINAINFPQGEQLYTILGPGLTEEAAWPLAYRTGVIGDRL
jgi:glycerol-1-phosphate dehydrogenase [NAD(P)+]